MLQTPKLNIRSKQHFDANEINCLAHAATGTVNSAGGCREQEVK